MILVNPSTEEKSENAPHKPTQAELDDLFREEELIDDESLRCS